MRRRRWSKYGAFTVVAARQTLQQRGALLGRFGFFLILLLVFSRLWQVAYRGTGSAVDMIWYLTVTEWIALSLPLVHLDFEEDVKSGAIAYQLCRPVSYVGMRFAEGLGQLAVRFFTLGIVGILLARGLSGGWPSHPGGLWLAAPLGVLSGVVNLLFQATIGLSAFWLQDTSPVYWVWQKATFILGGLLLPLSLYPIWLQKIALVSPFAALLYGPARAALHGDIGEAARTAVQLVIWGAVAAAILGAVFARARRIAEVNGG